MLREPVRLLTDLGLREHFRDLVETSLHRQQLSVRDSTTGYVVSLLTDHLRPGHLFTAGPEGPELRTLAERYADVAHAEGAGQRRLALKGLGDLALFIAGMFSGYLNRRLVDVDYFIAMGCGAYRELHDAFGARQSGDAVFAELSREFPRLVDVLAEISDESHLGASTDLLREYELWLRTGSPRIAAKLARRGILPAASNASLRQH